MKERFTNEEWELLKFLPFQIFTLVAAADGNVDNKEIGTFLKQLESAATLKDELHRQLLVDLVREDHQRFLEGSLDMEKTMKSAEVIKPILVDKLSSEEYQRFIGSLFVGGLHIANASGGFLGMGSKVSKEEKAALAVFGAIYEFDPSIFALNN